MSPAGATDLDPLTMRGPRAQAVSTPAVSSGCVPRPRSRPWRVSLSPARGRCAQEMLRSRALPLQPPSRHRHGELGAIEATKSASPASSASSSLAAIKCSPCGVGTKRPKGRHRTSLGRSGLSLGEIHGGRRPSGSQGGAGRPVSVGMMETNPPEGSSKHGEGSALGPARRGSPT